MSAVPRHQARHSGDGPSADPTAPQPGAAQPGAAARAPHEPVLLAEVIELLRSGRDGEPQGWIVDGTLGAGGHARAVLEACPQMRLLGCDQDPDALEIARANLAPFQDRVRLRRSRLSELSRTIRKERIGRPAAMLFDLGVSSMHLDRPERGFSFLDDGPLDMRMDPTRERTAADVVNSWDESDLADLLYYEGDETRARKIARAIVESRRRVPFLRTGALAETIAVAVDWHGGPIHPATKSFQAIRRAVNEEGEELRSALNTADHWLAHDGCLLVVSFHSGEDREVKRFLKRSSAEGRWETITRKPLSATREERSRNRRSRSARLRAARRRREDAGLGFVDLAGIADPFSEPGDDPFHGGGGRGA